MNQIILSPHFDDAAFSCYHLLNKNKTIVINIFACKPAKNNKNWWDILTCHFNSYQLMIDRDLENKLALNGIIKQSINLNYLDSQYRHLKLDLESITDEITSYIQSDSDIIYAPLAIGQLFSHPDHIAIRQIGEALCSRNFNVVFYADFPYMKMTLFDLNSRRFVLNKKINTRFNLDGNLTIIKLSKKEQEAKIKLMKSYKTQYTMTNFVSLGRLSSAKNHQYEIEYRV